MNIQNIQLFPIRQQQQKNPQSLPVSHSTYSSKRTPEIQVI